MKKKKIYVLTLSEVFPVTHSRKGQPTEFKDKMLHAICEPYMSNIRPKMHTIRANYELWKKRFDKILRGEAILSIRQWTGKPYRSEQVEIAILTCKDGIGIQRLMFDKSKSHPNVDYKPVGVGNLANNDGLSLEDWREWFKDYDLTKPLAIIHFTHFRY